MFNVKITDLRDFDMLIGFWGGARKIWDDLTEDEKDVLDIYAEDYDFNSITSVNDYVWFDSYSILEEFHNEVG